MINLEKYDNKNQIICEPKEIELKIEYGFKQHLIIVDRITQDSFYMDVKNEICNPHLKQVSLTFGSTIINNELLDVVNDRNHIIKDIRIEFDVFNLDNAISLVNLAVVSSRISKEQGKVIRNQIQNIRNN